jgi:hypothetical protein
MSYRTEMTDDLVLLRAVAAQIDAEALGVEADADDGEVKRKLARIAAIRAWSEQLPSEGLRKKYAYFLDIASQSIEAREDFLELRRRASARVGELPPLPTDLPPL